MFGAVEEVEWDGVAVFHSSRRATVLKADYLGDGRFSEQHPERGRKAALRMDLVWVDCILDFYACHLS